jgi:hypothetical protein
MAGGSIANFPMDGLWRVSALLKRRDGVDGAAFADRLISDLVPAMTDALDRAKIACRVVVDLPPVDLDPTVRGLFPPLFDGLVGFWFDDAAQVGTAMQAILASADAARIAAGLIDASASVVWLAEVFPVKREEGRSRVKFLAGGDVADGWAIEDAQRYWRDVHPVVAQTAPTVWGPLTRYVQFHGGVVPAGIDGSSWLGRWRRVPMCAEMGFADARDFITNYSNDEYQRIVRPDEEKFSRPGEMLAFVTGEQREFPAGG